MPERHKGGRKMDQPKRQMGRVVREPMSEDLHIAQREKAAGRGQTQIQTGAAGILYEAEFGEEAYGRGKTSVSDEMENPGGGIAKACPGQTGHRGREETLFPRSEQPPGKEFGGASPAGADVFFGC